MKSKWQYKFRTYDFVLEKKIELKLLLEFQKPYPPKNEFPRQIPFDLCLKPDFKSKMTDESQNGWIYITIPYPLEKSQKIIHSILFQIYNKMNFEYGKFEILTGFYLGEHLPETKSEKDQIGENKYFGGITIEEVPNVPHLNTKKIEKTFNQNIDIGLASQFNHAKQANHIIEKFIGFFKILEDRYSTNNPNESAKIQLKNDELYEIYKTIVIQYNSRSDFELYIDSIVDARHKCSHLKRKNKFGYLPSDKKLQTEVKPLISTLEKIAYNLVLINNI